MLTQKSHIAFIFLWTFSFMMAQCASPPQRAININGPLPPLNKTCLHFQPESQASVHDRVFVQAIQSGLRRDSDVALPLCVDGKNEGGSVIRIIYNLQLSARIITQHNGLSYIYVQGTRIDYDIRWIDGEKDALAYKSFTQSKTKELIYMRYDVEPPGPVVQRTAEALNQLILAVNRPNDGFRGTWRTFSGDEEYEIIYNTETSRFEAIQKKPKGNQQDSVSFWFTIDADQREEEDGEEASAAWIMRKESTNSTKEHPQYETEEIESTVTLHGQLLNLDVRGPYGFITHLDRVLIKVKRK